MPEREVKPFTMYADNATDQETAPKGLEHLTPKEMLEWALAHPMKEHTDEWLWLTTKLLGLTPTHILAVEIVLKELRWRKARDPRAYVKTCAVRVLRRLGLDDEPQERLRNPNIDEEGHALTLEKDIDYAAYEGPVKQAGVWKHRNPDPIDPNDFDEENVWLTPRERLLRLLPRDVKTTVALSPETLAIIEAWNAHHPEHTLSTEPRTIVNWCLIAADAGLDPDERFVLFCKILGISRDKAIACEKTAQEQRRVAAAWRRFHRTGMDRLRKAIS